MELKIFTPVNEKTGIRAKMQISESDQQVFRANKGKRRYVTIHDYVTGTNYYTKSASCGLGCKCDAVYIDKVKVYDFTPEYYKLRK